MPDVLLAFLKHLRSENKKGIFRWQFVPKLLGLFKHKYASVQRKLHEIIPCEFGCFKWAR